MRTSSARQTVDPYVLLRLHVPAQLRGGDARPRVTRMHIRLALRRPERIMDLGPSPVAPVESSSICGVWTLVTISDMWTSSPQQNESPQKQILLSWNNSMFMILPTSALLVEILSPPRVPLRGDTGLVPAPAPASAVQHIRICMQPRGIRGINRIESTLMVARS